MSIIIDHLNYIYNPGTTYEVKALSDINLKIDDGEFIGLIGHTGSGKSTLIQHLNGLIKATSGAVYFNGQDIYDDGYDLRALRTKVGLVFQYPEHQLFETTVMADVCFGPKNQGLAEKDAMMRAVSALNLVHFPEKHFYDSPFELSGGQKRRVAIAGVLAMKPEVLILDEPTAGLDPKGREEILSLVLELREKEHITVILVSHSMEDIAHVASRIIVMNRGCVAYDGTPREVFRYADELKEIGLAAPEVTYLMKDLAAAGFPLSTDITTTEEARAEILRHFTKNGLC